MKLGYIPPMTKGLTDDAGYVIPLVEMLEEVGIGVKPGRRTEAKLLGAFGLARDPRRQGGAVVVDDDDRVVDDVGHRGCVFRLAATSKPALGRRELAYG